MTPGTGWQPSDNFLTRIKRAYRLALASTRPNGGMWVDIDSRRRDVHDAIVADGPLDHLRRIIADPISTDLYYGVDGLCRSILGKKGDDTVFVEQVLTVLNHSIDIVFEKVANSSERDFKALDTALRQHIEFPNPFRGEIGVSTVRGVASERSIAALYQVALLGPPDKSVIEIGPGIGRTAFYAHRAGFKDYSTVDLPIGIVAQASFLGATLGENAVWLLGDPLDAKANRVKLYATVPNERYDVAVNVDSMTEMHMRVAFGYLRWISRQCDEFISINHEKNTFSVRPLASAAIDADYRFQQHPLRHGYIEEYFTSISPRQASALRYLGLRAEAFLRARLSWPKIHNSGDAA